MSPTHNRRLSPSPVREVKPKVEVKEECPSPPPSSSSSSYCYGQNDLKRKEPVKVKVYLTVLREKFGFQKEEDAFSRMLGTEGVPKVKKPKRMEWSDDVGYPPPSFDALFRLISTTVLFPLFLTKHNIPNLVCKTS